MTTMTMTAVATSTYAGRRTGLAAAVAPGIASVAGTGRFPGKWARGRSEVHGNDAQVDVGDDEDDEGLEVTRRTRRVSHTAATTMLGTQP